MSIYKMNDMNKSKAEELFNCWWDSLIPSALAGCMGHVWCNDEKNPDSAQIINADFCYFAGEPDKELALNMPEEFTRDFMVLVPLTDKWDRYLNEVYDDKITKVTRYAIKKEPDSIFDVDKLQSFVDRLDKKYKIVDIESDEEAYNKALEEKWSEDMCINYDSFKDYSERGLGVGVMHDGVLVAGASSYTVYPKGIEITIHCREDYRQRGLATVCGAALILKCLGRKLHPNWDARTMISVGLATKLGYHFNREYTAYDYDKRA